METKTIVSYVVQNFQLDLVKGQEEITAEYGLVGQMREQIQLRVSPAGR